MVTPTPRYAGTPLTPEGRPAHHLFLLDARPGQRMTWQQAKDWAASVGGELPTPQEQSLLYAKCRDALPLEWCWSSEQDEEDTSCAWRCNFSNGHQYGTRKRHEGSAVAVRRLPLESFNPFDASAPAPAATGATAAPGTFTHTPRPAHVSKGKFSNQRRFGTPRGKNLPEDTIAATDREKGELSVYRDGEEDLAEVSLRIGLMSRASITLRMTPAELRSAAATLLDAAHDIDTLPAAVLARASEGSAA